MAVEITQGKLSENMVLIDEPTSYFMNIRGKWWELYDRKGNLWTLAPVAEHDLTQAMHFFTDYLKGRSVENPVIRDYSEIFLQG
tara:strand:- start:919 stop:1170 length:252 start_codon:yes stop_codon:yes gene_type:complete